MTPTAAITATITAPAATSPVMAGAEQLVLLSEEGVLPAQFRLDHRTRERGLAHVAALRAQIAARAASRQEGGLRAAA